MFKCIKKFIITCINKINKGYEINKILRENMTTFLWIFLPKKVPAQIITVENLLKNLTILLKLKIQKLYLKNLNSL